MSVSTRQAFGEALADLGAKDPRIVTLDADLAKSTKSEIFAKKFPDRFFEMGIAEANMIGTACGLAFAGKIPFLCSFGCFLTGRYDTIRISAAYAQANIRLVGTHAGIGIGDDGYSQMGLEDLSLMRSLPTMGVFQPMDAEETKRIMEALVSQWTGPAYLRLTRQNLPHLFNKNSPWTFTKIHQISESGAGDQKIALLATGAAVEQAAKAAEVLKTRSNVAVSVWNVHCLKPFDEATCIRILQSHTHICTVEDHSVIGGLGTCVAEVMAKSASNLRLMKLGIQDVFGESGDPAELYEKFGISSQAIARQIIESLGR